MLKAKYSKARQHQPSNEIDFGKSKHRSLRLPKRHFSTANADPPPVTKAPRKSRAPKTEPIPDKLTTILPTPTITSKKAPAKKKTTVQVIPETIAIDDTALLGGNLQVEKVKKVKKSTKANNSTAPVSASRSPTTSLNDDGMTTTKATPAISRTKTKTIIDHSVVTTSQTVSKTVSRKLGKADDHDNVKFRKQVDMDPTALSPDNVVLTTWNLAGMRGAVKNGLWDKVKGWQRTPDVLCLQEVKISASQLNDLPQNSYTEPMKQLGLTGIHNHGERAGYAGVGVWYNHSKFTSVKFATDSSLAYTLPPKNSTVLIDVTKPTSISADQNTNPVDPMLVKSISQITGDIINDGMRTEVWNCIKQEGRILTVDFGSFYLVNTYVPNSGQDLDRLGFRFTIYEPVILEYLLLLEKKKPVIYTGDLNVARDPADVHTPSVCQKSAGFQAEERDRLHRLVGSGKLTDTYRTIQGDDVHGYTYWGHRGGSRARDQGWRIDYFLTSQVLDPHLKGSMVTDEFKPARYDVGRISDHAPLWVSFDGAILKKQ